MTRIAVKASFSTSISFDSTPGSGAVSTSSSLTTTLSAMAIGASLTGVTLIFTVPKLQPGVE